MIPGYIIIGLVFACLNVDYMTTNNSAIFESNNHIIRFNELKLTERIGITILLILFWFPLVFLNIMNYYLNEK